MGWTFDAAAEFVQVLGINVRVEDGATGFIDGLRILDGRIEVASDSDRHAGDLLHEAGHIAVIPSRFRHLASGSLKAVSAAMASYLDDHPDGLGYPEDPICRAILQSGEMEAIAWSYAAALACGIDTRLPFMNGFDGKGDEIHMMVATGHHFGVHGLSAAGMTRIHGRGGFKPFPHMERWLQD